MSTNSSQFDKRSLEKSLHSVGALSDDQEALVLNALLLKQRDCGEVDKDTADDLLRDLEKQNLISSYNRRDIINELYGS